MRPPVRVRIDRLVLEGVPPAQRPALVRALQQELARRLQGQDLAGAGLPPRTSLTLPAAGDGASAGAAAAQALAKSLGGRR
jgi:hypothetical protein